MHVERPRMALSGAIVSIATFAGVAALALGGGLVDRAGSATTLERPARERVRAPRAELLSRRLAAMDDALRGDRPGAAMHDWQAAYGLALGLRRWDAMLSIGDAALRLEASARRDPTAHPGRFRAAARQAYLWALFQARSERSPEGIDRVAQAFAAIGDTEMAARARAIRVSR
jgi:hypothetical protein